MNILILLIIVLLISGAIILLYKKYKQQSSPILPPPFTYSKQADNVWVSSGWHDDTCPDTIAPEFCILPDVKSAQEFCNMNENCIGYLQTQNEDWHKLFPNYPDAVQLINISPVSTTTIQPSQFYLKKVSNMHCSPMCTSPRICSQGVCILSSNACNYATDCPNSGIGQKCVQNQCLPDTTFLCSQDSDCKNGQICSKAGECMAQNTCLITQDCLAGSQCVQNKCTPVMECNQDSDCTISNLGRCVNGSCVQCLEDNDCSGNPYMSSCVGNMCVECKSSADCDPLQCSPLNKCVQCLSDANCLSGQVCTGNKCVNV